MAWRSHPRRVVATLRAERTLRQGLVALALDAPSRGLTFAPLVGRTNATAGRTRG
jgi:hypothetical protein